MTYAIHPVSGRCGHLRRRVGVAGRVWSVPEVDLSVAVHSCHQRWNTDPPDRLHAGGARPQVSAGTYCTCNT